VGDDVHVLHEDLHDPYKSTPVWAAASAVSGIVCSIRNVKTGKPVTKATGDMGDYVFEILDSRTLEPAFASLRSRSAPGLKQAVALALKKARESGRAAQDPTSFLRQGPLATVEGWRIVKLMATRLYTEPPPTAASPRRKR
jgi:hypothetical protein